jgi:hypothetical protein
MFKLLRFLVIFLYGNQGIEKKKIVASQTLKKKKKNE